MTMTPEQEFEDALVGDITVERNEDGAPPLPIDLNQADQWMAELRRLRRLRNEYVTAHQAAVARLNDRLASVTKPMDDTEALLIEALETFHRTLIAVDSKRMTVPLPNGTLKSRMGQPEIIYEDEDALLTWAIAERPDLVEFPPAPEPRVKKVDLRKVIKAASVSDGVALVGDDRTPIPGVIVHDAERKYDVKPVED